MGKILLAILLALALVLIPVSSAFAAKTATVTITAKPGYISITNDPLDYDFGVVEESTDNQTGETYFTITNSSQIVTDIEIKCDGWAGATDNWTYGAAGVDTGQLIASDGAGGYDITILVDPAEALLFEDVAVGVDPQWGVELNAPTDFVIEDEQTTHITLRAHKYT